jgi:16S rRNA (cytidine1402-2'-O)-methyltransferase
MIYFVPTPIGNLGDITVRSKEILATSEIIICEDTRHTNKLLELLSIKNGQKLISMMYREKFNFTQIDRILNDTSNEYHDIISIVSDAGTPGISDPGYEILELILKYQLNYTVLPGATAFVPALVASGLPSHEFLFIGFLPNKKGRQTKLKTLAALSDQTIIFYESSHRLDKILVELNQYFSPETLLFVANDISKMHEKFWRGKLVDLTLADLGDKGEYVFVVHQSK